MAVDAIERGIEVPKVFITGGTSGVGLEMAKQFAESGYAVGVGYGRNEKAANATLATLRDISDKDHKAFRSDISNRYARLSLFGDIDLWTGSFNGLMYRPGANLSHVVLAASGGLEEDKKDVRETYPYEINARAQLELYLLARERMRNKQSTITFLTSHQAFYFGRTVSILGSSGVEEHHEIAPWSAIDQRYAPIALTKHLGISLLLEASRNAEITAVDKPRLLVSSTDLITDSKVARMASFVNKTLKGAKEERLAQLIANRQAQLEKAGLDKTLLNSAEFATLAVRRALDPDWFGERFELFPDHLKQNGLAIMKHGLAIGNLSRQSTSI